MKKTTEKTTGPADNCLLIVTNKNTRTRCAICLKLTVKTVERRHVIDFALTSLLLTLNIFHTFS